MPCLQADWAAGVEEGKRFILQFFHSVFVRIWSINLFCCKSLVNSITGVTFEITSEVCVTTCSISSCPEPTFLNHSHFITDDVWLWISSEVLLVFFIFYFLLPLQRFLYPLHFVSHTSTANETKSNVNQAQILPCPWALMSESCQILQFNVVWVWPYKTTSLLYFNN